MTNYSSMARLVQFFVAGFASLAYQIVSFKLISIAGLGDALSVAISLTAFVSLSGIGALLAGRCPARQAGAWESLLGVYALAVFGTLWLAGIEPVVALSGGLALWAKLAAFLALTAPLAFLSGMLIPLHQYRQGRFAGEDAQFLSFVPVYVLFHIGGAISLLLIEWFGFPNLGWPLVGAIIASLSLANGVAVWCDPVGCAQDVDSHGRASSSPARWLIGGLLAISIITGYVGILSYKAFDYLVGPNIRNYTVVTALIFFGLSLSGVVAQRWALTFRGILGVTGLGILCLFVPVVVVPPFAVTILESGASHWWIYAIAGVLLIVPAYTLMGVSIPSAVRLGVRSDHALFVVSIGNALGYWLFISTAHFNVDAFVMLLAAGTLLLLGAVRLWLVAVPVVGLFAMPLGSVYHSAIHHMILEHRLTTMERFLISLPSPGDQPFMDRSSDHLEFKVVESWNTYGWSVDHVRVNRWASVQRQELLNSSDKLIIGGFQSLSMETPAHTMFAESMAAGLPALVAPRNDRAMVLGAGTGVSANAIAEHFAHTDLVDLSPDTLAQLRYFEPINGAVAGKVALQSQDALSYLRDKAVQGAGQYDLIFSTVTGAGYPYSAMLYTEEFFALAKRNLSDDGVFSFWMDERFNWDDGAGAIVSSVRNTFRYVRHWTIWPEQPAWIADANSAHKQPPVSVPYHVVVASDAPIMPVVERSAMLDFLRAKQRVLLAAWGVNSDDNFASYESASDLLNARSLPSRENTALESAIERATGPSSASYLRFSYAYDLLHATHGRRLTARMAYAQE